jgi:hypothetical protein
MTRILRKSPLYLFLIIITILFSDCRRNHDVHVEGEVIDIYTHQPIPNLRVQLVTWSIADNSNPDDKEYYTYTDSEGKYSFDHTFFDKPKYIAGRTMVSDENNVYSALPAGGFGNKHDVKPIGKTNVVRNLEALCVAKLNLSRNGTYNGWYLMKISQKFIGTNYIYGYEDWGQPTYFYSYETGVKENSMIGYADGKVILKTELFTSGSVLLKTQYDTIISNGCGSTNNYTVTVN